MAQIGKKIQELANAAAKANYIVLAFENLKDSIHPLREKIAYHNAEIARLYAEIGEIEDRCANQLDIDLPGWRDIITGRVADEQAADSEKGAA